MANTNLTDLYTSYPCKRDYKTNWKQDLRRDWRVDWTATVVTPTVSADFSAASNSGLITLISQF